MKSKIALIVGGIFIGVFATALFQLANNQNVQVNNELCPVSGKPVDDSQTYIYKGKEYKLCSDECRQPLSENPENYLSE